jgi:sterol desaturase/sphingolipid hydroxylase (fatty acid hydroxylase superfamily)
MWYTFLGVIQYTFWEVLYIHCCATNRLPFVTNQQTFSNAWNFTMFCLAAFWVPLYREIHFYFSHRLIHIKALYKYIHSVHHRNTDIEPFAGLSMHPVEHLYYYSCVGPSLLIFGTPFAFMWMGLHLILSPAGDVIYKYFVCSILVSYFIHMRLNVNVCYERKKYSPNLSLNLFSSKSIFSFVYKKWTHYC